LKSDEWVETTLTKARKGLSPVPVLGLVPGANFAHECAIFEAVHGSAPDIAGKNIANSTGVLRSALLMLRHIGEADAAWTIRNAIDQVYRDRSKLTRDVGGSAGTSEFADAIIQAMEAPISSVPQESKARSSWELPDHEQRRRGRTHVFRLQGRCSLIDTG
jgi:isocitrate/isopropylmalate dehydrogenase